MRITSLLQSAITIIRLHGAASSPTAPDDAARHTVHFCPFSFHAPEPVVYPSSQLKKSALAQPTRSPHLSSAENRRQRKFLPCLDSGQCLFISQPAKSHQYETIRLIISPLHSPRRQVYRPAQIHSQEYMKRPCRGRRESLSSSFADFAASSFLHDNDELLDIHDEGRSMPSLAGRRCEGCHTRR